MNLIKYDNKCIQIECIDGKTYEGICSHNSKDYNYHEYGRDEESLVIFHFLFYKDDIKKISIIDKFTNDFGEIEIETAKDPSLLEQALEDEEDVHVYRLLCYLETIDLSNRIINLLKGLIKYNENDKIVQKAKELINNKRDDRNGYRKRGTKD